MKSKTKQHQDTTSKITGNTIAHVLDKTLHHQIYLLDRMIAMSLLIQLCPGPTSRPPHPGPQY
eukprot:12792040-Ditylum_brightwellii.AAC.1